MAHSNVTMLLLIVALFFTTITPSRASKSGVTGDGLGIKDQLNTVINTLHNTDTGQYEFAEITKRLQELVTQERMPVAAQVSAECQRDYDTYVSDSNRPSILRPLYVWQFKDSDGRLPPGVTDMNLNWLGSFDVCRRAAKMDGDEEVFNGLYCLSYTQLISSIGLRIARCLPSSCSDEDAYSLISEEFGWNATSVACARRVNLTVADWATVIVTVIFFCLVMSATILDAILRMKTKRILTGPDESGPSNVADTTKPAQQTGFATDLLLNFSVGKTFPKILSSETSHTELKPMAGFIVLSVTYCILYNTSTTITYFTANILSAFQKQRDTTSLVVANGSTCFDSLFTLSGILVAYSTLKEMDKNNGKFQWFKYYCCRLWRLLPMYVLSLMWYATLIRHIAYGPFSMAAFTRPDVVACSKYWWANILFVNNFVTGRIDDVCMESSWYIANDMQFFFISPLLIILFYKKPKIAYMLMTVLLAMCLAVRGVIANKYNIQPLIYSPPEDPEVTDHFYLRPYYRIAPYLTGLFTGYLMWRTKCKVKMTWWVAVIGWVVAFGSGFTVVYGLIGYFSDLAFLPLGALTVYQTVNRWVWSIAVSWSVFACVTGNGGPITMVLGWSGFIPLVRLCFIMYLTHLHLVQTYLHSLMQAMPYTPYVVMYMYVGHLFLGVMLSLVCSSIMETPLNSIAKKVVRHFSKAKEKTECEEQSNTHFSPTNQENDYSNISYVNDSNEISVNDNQTTNCEEKSVAKPISMHF